MPHRIDVEGEVGRLHTYQKFGISSEMVERVKIKMKDPAVKARVKTVLNNVTKADLQNRARVKKLLSQTSKVLGERLSEQQAEAIVRYVIAQKIDPRNTLHLIKLWNTFR